MGPGRNSISKQSLRKPTTIKTKNIVVRASQSILDSKGNIFIKRRKRKQQELLAIAPKKSKILTLPSRLLRLSRLNKMLLVLIVVCVFILYTNLEHLVRKANFAFLLPSSVSSLTAPINTTRINANEQSNQDENFNDEQKTSKSEIAAAMLPFPQPPEKTLSLKFLPQHSLSSSSSLSSMNNHNHNGHHHHQEKILGNASHMHINVIGGGDVNLKATDYNIFVIYTKENYQLHAKFELFTRSLFKHTSIPLHLHVITDRASKNSVEEMIQQQMRRFRRNVVYTLYDVQACAEQIVDIVSTMRPYFSSTPKSYYGDALFYLSLGLHRIADKNLDRAVLLDCDIVFRSDVRQLFAEFARFSDEHLFGLAPELTPVYRHILYRYRVNFPGTSFGNPYYPMRMRMHSADRSIGASLEEQLRLKRRVKHGYPGLNSGVVLLHLARIRSSQLFNEQLMPAEVQRLTTKYSFRGHLGDQDFYTLFGYEFPHLIYRLDCVWNRQLCTWWKNHGYSEVFDAYFHCEGRIRMYHGNCNTRVPE